MATSAIPAAAVVNYAAIATGTAACGAGITLPLPVPVTHKVPRAASRAVVGAVPLSVAAVAVSWAASSSITASNGTGGGER